MNTKPFLPSDLRRDRTGTPIFRAATAVLLSHVRNAFMADVLREHWPRDHATELVVKGATVPATSSNPTWAAEMIGLGTADIVSVLGPASAGAALLARGLQFRFDGTGSITVASIAAAAANATFLAEGGAIPVRELSTGSPTILTPRKFAVISTFTNEIFKASVPNIEALVRQVLVESVGAALDVALLDANPASVSRPAGLRNGIAALTASNQANANEAAAEDIGALVGGVANIAGNNAIVFVAAPQQAAALRAWTRNNFTYEILASSGLAAGTVVCVASNALASACDVAPRLEISNTAVLHMDTTPTDITTGAVSASVKSLYQSDSVGLRLIMEVSWALRNPGGLAWVQNTGW